MRRLSVFFGLVRAKQWIKNLFVLAPVVFSGRFTDAAACQAALFAFVLFCFISSGAYIINDLIDIKRDQSHPRKCLRPLACGKISKGLSLFLAGGLISISLGLAFFLGWALVCCAGLYLILHGIYNGAGKKIILMDVGCIALGFCIRVWAGAVAIGVVPSGWLLTCVFLLALFLGFTKRRSEMVELEEKSAAHRSVLRQYSLCFLDQAIIISATLTIVFYGLYTISSEIVDRVHGHAMVYSTGFVVYGIFRYFYLIHGKKIKEEADEILLKDAPLVLDVLAWVVFSFAVLY